MKNLYPKGGKGKIHPSPSIAALSLLPATVLSIASALSFDDQEVLAYLILRSVAYSSKTASTAPNKCRKKQASPSSSLHCGCFDCYYSFWTRWNSSPNRELIHHAIEAFEEHHSRSELIPKKTKAGKSRQRRVVSAEKSASQIGASEPQSPGDGVDAVSAAAPASEEEASDAKVSDRAGEVAGEEENGEGSSEGFGSGQEQRGPARKVWPDVFGLFNSRFWSLWSPNV